MWVTIIFALLHGFTIWFLLKRAAIICGLFYLVKNYLLCTNKINIMKNLKLSQGFNNAWFIHQNNKLILGSHDEQLLREILVFLENKDKFKHLLENQPKQEKLFDNTI